MGRVAKELGYRRPPVEVEGPAVVGIGMPRLETYALLNPYFVEVLRGVYGVFRTLPGWSVALEDLDRLPHLPVEGSWRGVILVSPDDVAYPFERTPSLPTVVVDATGPEGFASVIADNQAGCFALTQHLLLRGHQRIAFVGQHATDSAAERLAGFRQALAVAQVTVPNDYVVSTEGFTFDDGARAVEKLWALPERPTAVVAFNDFMAMGALSYFRAHDISVPTEVSVAGHDGTRQLARYAVPSLTTVDQHAFEQGYTAATMLINLLSRHPLPAPRVRLTPQLILGESTAQAQHVLAAL